MRDEPSIGGPGCDIWGKERFAILPTAARGGVTICGYNSDLIKLSVLTDSSILLLKVHLGQAGLLQDWSFTVDRGLLSCGICPQCSVHGRLLSSMGSFRAQRPIKNPRRKELTEKISHKDARNTISMARLPVINARDMPFTGNLRLPKTLRGGHELT
jgi:hypothetical protein